MSHDSSGVRGCEVGLHYPRNARGAAHLADAHARAATSARSTIGGGGYVKV